MSDPALGINSILQEDVSDTTQPDSHASSAESIWEKETWDNKALTEYLLRCIGHGPCYLNELPNSLEGDNFIAKQAVLCNIRSRSRAWDNPTSQIEEGVAITTNPFAPPTYSAQQFNFHQVSGNLASIEFPGLFGDDEITIATVHSHPGNTAPSALDVYSLTYGRQDFVLTVGHLHSIYMLFPTKDTPKYNKLEMMKLSGIANEQMHRRFRAELNYIENNTDTTQISIERLNYFQTIGDRIIKDCSTRLANQLGIGMYHRSLLPSESKDTRFKRLV